ncbi:MAG: hypothetical protein JSV88_32040 [Candidatus Aminicenantes bacterium]|nr:MAG: hypothetical protein JSV88_32040 [Candidatus Aminicenantes bacterium]
MLKKTGSKKKQIIFVCSITILGALLYIFIDIFILQSRNGITKGNFFAKIPWLEIGLYFIMLLGMVSKYLFDAIGEKKRKKIKFNKWQFIKPFLVSPMIFAAVYAMIPETTSALLLLIFAYQNGFFWHTVLYKVAPNQ